jgi:hypothetical protein
MIRVRRAAGIVLDSLAAAPLKVNPDADIMLKGRLVAIEPESRVFSNQDARWRGQ